MRKGAESSLSHRCDPRDQAPATPEPSIIHVDGERPFASKSPGILQNQHNNPPQEDPKTATPRLNSIRRRAHRLRPRSWLPFSRSAPSTPYPRSFSTQLTKTTSTSTVARSVISAPILTSTTNVAVARTEGVHFGEISDLAFSQSTWNSQVGWVATNSQDSGATPQSEASEQLASGRQGAQQNVLPDKQPSSGKGRILRLKNVIRSKIRNGHVDEQAQHVAGAAEDEIKQDSVPAVKRDLSRRRAETLNLYKGKIKELTGNGHIRRRSGNNSKLTAESREGGDPPLLGDIIDVPTTDFAAEHSDGESPFGSLTKSFASAVDKLDFYSTLPRNISFLRSRSSFFNLKKTNKDSGDLSETGQQFPPISPCKPAPPISQAIAASSQAKPPASMAPGDTSRSLSTVPGVGAFTPTHVQRSLPKGNESPRRSHPSPMIFLDRKNGYVTSEPVAGSPRGVNPLRMHPPDTMATAPAPSSRQAQYEPFSGGAPPTPRRQPTTPTVDIGEDSDSASLEDAPIYSPSLGDLSQYAKDTPRSADTAPSETTKVQAANATPTRSPMKSSSPRKGIPGVLRKSKSGGGLFHRSKPDNNPVTANNHAAQGGLPLHQRDANQKMANNTGKAIKKSRSLHFGGLFKKDEHPDLRPSVPSSPFQPATPSPLRKVTRYSSQSTKGGNSPTTLPARK